MICDSWLSSPVLKSSHIIMAAGGKMIVYVDSPQYSLPPEFISQSGIFQHTKARTFHDPSVGSF